MSSIQVKVALRKEAKPELYCPERKCLWETGDGSRCPRHGGRRPRPGVFDMRRELGRAPTAQEYQDERS